MKRLNKKTITEVVKFCNRDLVPDENFDLNITYPSDWFEQYFSYIGDERIQKQLGEAFYQARFMYKLMCALNFPLQKQRGFVKFQIVQYASICEAVLDVAIEKFFKSEAEEDLAVFELQKENALAADVRITKGGAMLYVCKEKKKKGVLKRTRVDFKTKFAVKKGILSQNLKDRLDILYDLRNNIHILKAAENDYKPKLYEARDAFLLMTDFVEYLKNYYQLHNTQT